MILLIIIKEIKKKKKINNFRKIKKKLHDTDNIFTIK